MIRITSKHDGFRRCGIPHYRAGVEYADERFTAAELKILRAEPMLTVEMLPAKIAAAPPAGGPKKAGPQTEKPAAGDPKKPGTQAEKPAAPRQPDLKKRADEIDAAMTVPQLADALKAAGVEVKSGLLKSDLIGLYIQETDGR